MSYRIDYAADGHPVWLSVIDDDYPTVKMAVKVAQTKLELWPPCVGFRIVVAEHPLFEKIEERHIGKMVGEDGTILIP